MLEWLPVIFLFFLGLAVGSHLNVLILRFGFEEKGAVRSHCAQCGAQISWFDLVPVFSYLMLRGRCRFCGSALSLQYPLVELGTGVLFVLLYLTHTPALNIGGLVSFFALLTFLAAAVAIVAYDLRHTLIPLPFVYLLLTAAALVRLAEAFSVGSSAPLVDAALGAALLAGFFGAIVLFTRGRGMGAGDIYVGGAIGVLLGIVGGLSAVVFGVWLATAFYIAILCFGRIWSLGSRTRVTMKSEVPFAPWLIGGCVVVLMTGASFFMIIEWLGRFV